MKLSKKSISLCVHPAGEDRFEFETFGGKVAFEATGATMTPYGGLAPFAAFLKKLGFVDELVRTCPVTRTSGNAAPVRDIVVSLILLNICDGRRFAHVHRLREDPAVAELFGIRAVRSDDTIKRFLKSIPRERLRPWIDGAAACIRDLLPERIINDWDSTVITRYGEQEHAKIGYNPTKPGRPSHHPLLSVAAGTRIATHYRQRPGNTVTATDWEAAMEDCLSWLGPGRIALNRGDIGLGQESVMAWHETTPGAPAFLFKLKLTKNVMRQAAMLDETAWAGPGKLGAWQVAEAGVKLPSWTNARRVVFARRIQHAPEDEQSTLWKELRHEYDAYVTSLPVESANAWQIVLTYRDRADCENLFDELKNQWGLGGFCAADAGVTEGAARFTLASAALWNLFLRLMEPSRHVEAPAGRRWCLLMASRLVKTGRQMTLQVCVNGEWWAWLKEGYARLRDWLRQTAAQLSPPPPATSLRPALNCGI